jgi:hypothetical protein
MNQSEEITAGTVQQSTEEAKHLAMPLYLKAIKTDTTDYNKEPPIGYCVCDILGNYLTDSVPKTVCKELIEICNEHYYRSLRSRKEGNYKKDLFYAEVPVEPMSKPVARAIIKTRNGNLAVAEPAEYQRYLHDFEKALLSTTAICNDDLPIKRKVQVTGIFYCGSKNNKSIASYMESLLDCLVYSDIIKSTGHETVNNTDGSRVYTDESNPRVLVFIRTWGE